MIKKIMDRFHRLSIQTRLILTFLLIIVIGFTSIALIIFLIFSGFISDAEIAGLLTDQIKSKYLSIQIWLFILGIGMTLLSVVISFFASKYFTAQFDKVQNLLTSYLKGDYHKRGPISTTDETGQIMENLHNLAETLEEKHGVIGKLQDRVFDLFNNAPSMLCVMDLTGIIKKVNLTFKNELSLKEGDLIGKPFINLITDNDKSLVGNSLKTFLLSKNADTLFECKLSHPEKKMIVVRVGWNFISENPDGEFTTKEKIDGKEVYGIRINLLDISSLKEYEQQKLAFFETMTVVPKLLGKAVAAEELLEFILKQMHKSTHFDIASVLLSPAEGVDHMLVSAIFGMDGKGKSVIGKSFSMSDTRLNDAIIHREKRIINQRIFEELYPESQNNGQSHTFLIPLIIFEELFGLLTLEKVSGGNFTVEEQDIAEAYASLAAGAIQSVLLRQEVQARNIEINRTVRELEYKDKNIQRELDMAVSIQQGILPEAEYSWHGINVISHYEAMGKVGGDFYDYFHFPHQGDLGIFIADVSGHGIPAALVTTMAKISFTTAAQNHFSPSKILEEVNIDLCKNIKTDDYLTVFFLTIDKSYNVTYVNAGHQVALLYRKKEKKLERLDTPGYFVGLMGEMGESYSEAQLQLEYGDRIILYTDGIIEAMNKNREEFGIELLEKLICENVNTPAKDLEQIIIDRVKQFSEGLKQKDDLSLMIIELDEEYERVAQTFSEGKKNFKLGNYQESIFFFKKALELDPNNLDTLLIIAEAHFRTHQFDASVNYFEKYIRNKDNNPLVYYHLALCYFKLKDFDRSIEANLTALKIDKEFIQSIHLLGLTHKKRGSFEDAKKCFNDLLEIEPDNQKAIKEMIYLDSLS